MNKLHARELQAAQLLAAIVTITKGDFAILDPFQPAVADGGSVFRNLIRPAMLE